MAYDNAVSALGKICQFHRDSIDAAQVRSIFVAVFWPSQVSLFPFSVDFVSGICPFIWRKWRPLLLFLSYICFWISFKIFFQKIKDIQQKCITSLVTCYEAQVPSRYGVHRYDIS